MAESIFDDIDRFLATENQDRRDENLIQGGILLALLCLRGLTTRSKTIEVRAGDHDARRLIDYLVEPGLAPGLATMEPLSQVQGKESWMIRPNWERLATLYGRSPGDFDRLLKDQFPKMLNRHRLTFAYMLANG